MLFQWTKIVPQHSLNNDRSLFIYSWITEVLYFFLCHSKNDFLILSSQLKIVVVIVIWSFPDCTDLIAMSNMNLKKKKKSWQESYIEKQDKQKLVHEYFLWLVLIVSNIRWDFNVKYFLIKFLSFTF